MARVLVPLAQGCEELEAVTIIDLLRRAGIEVITAGLDDRPVVASRKTTILPDTTLEEALHQEYDMVVLPGGMPGADHLDNDARIHVLLKRMAENGKFVAAIGAEWISPDEEPAEQPTAARQGVEGGGPEEALGKVTGMGVSVTIDPPAESDPAGGRGGET